MKNQAEDFKKFANSKGVNSLVLHDYQMKVEIPNVVNMTPYIFEQNEKRGTLMDVYSRLMVDRIIFLGGGVRQELTDIILAQLLYLDTQSQEDITMFVNSPGGSVYAGNSVLDLMHYVNADVSTINVGMAASMGAVILSNGAKGKRLALPLSRTMIHQVSSGTEGTFSDMRIQMQETESVRNDLYQILANNTGKTFEQIEKDCERDNWMKAEQAKEYGLVDEVITPKKLKEIRNKK